MVQKRYLFLMLLLSFGLLAAVAAKAQPTLQERVAGRLLLQVENRGQIWYIDKENYNRYKVTLDNALSIFRKLALGISTADLEKIPTKDEDKQGDMALRERLKGKILLQVEDKGRIWYVNPKDLKRYEVTRANLLDFFRSVALGVSNKDLYILRKGFLASEQLPKFDSCTALQEKLVEVTSEYGYGLGGFEEGMVLKGDIAPAPRAMAETAADTSAQAVDFSTTNVQVEGVDEADIVKTDGRYIYYVSQGNLTISRAYPANEAELLSTIEIEDISVREIFINGNNLMIFGDKYSFYEPVFRAVSVMPWRTPRNVTFVRIYDVTDRTNPVQKRTVEFEGRYTTSRMIGNYVYLIMNTYPDFPPVFAQEGGVSVYGDEDLIPVYQDNVSGEVVLEPIARCAEVSYIPPIVNNQFITVIGLPIDDYKKEITKEVILGSSENVYVSQDNIYIADTEYAYYDRPVPLLEGEESDDEIDSGERTVIYKLGLNKDEIVYYGQGKVAGRVLNQFSMDEYDNHFRIATTIGWAGSVGASNNIYVLDEDLNKVGEIEDIAPGEQIYSARFMGKKGYLVTFKKTDPFFTIDLSEHTSPKIVGKLKIPGYSDYLHPFDENHIIGIGKEAIEDESSKNFAWYQGMKIAMFDVTDFSNPKEMYKIEIGDRGTTSPLLNDHKALLFSKEKNLFALPILLAEIPESVKNDPETPSYTYGDYTFQGLYVYRITLDSGFELLGRLSHIDDPESYLKSGYYFRSDSEINRSLYINDNLYTMSPTKIMINDRAADLAKLGEVKLPTEKNKDDIYYWE